MNRERRNAVTAKYHEYILTMTTEDGDERLDTVRATSAKGAERQILKTYAKRGWVGWTVSEITPLTGREIR